MKSYLDLDQSSFRTSFGMETFLVTWSDDFRRDLEMRTARAMKCLLQLGFAGLFSHCFWSFLSGTSQRENIAPLPGHWHLEYIQCSVVSPMLFKIYMKRLVEVGRRVGL